MYATGLASLWEKVRAGETVEDDVEALEHMVMVCERIAERSIELGALTGKLMGGVVHPPKGE
jgi:hypothetical protein